MKAAPVFWALARRSGVVQTVVHTGQHYDVNMSDVFFKQLGIPTPDVNLEVGSGSHAQQTAAVMSRFEPVVLDRKPDMVLVYGDVNSTIAAALVCSKLMVPLAHVEAGLRSRDRSMPEEINRLLTDRLADLLFTPSEDGDRNLLAEGIAPEKIFCVGNVMIDSLVRLLPVAEQTRHEGVPDRYALVTLHRPVNVDHDENLRSLVKALLEINDELPVVFPVHPRTRARLAHFGLDVSRLHLLEPVPYVEFLGLQQRATIVITDSGGIQEETTYLRVPCLTVRCNTERPVTSELGTNILVGNDRARLLAEARNILAGNAKRGSVPPLWDGRAGERISDILTGHGSSSLVQPELAAAGAGLR
jgi:UDP-N-acetylglucosamine 2-epimerase (non-hydrolysing)